MNAVIQNILVFSALGVALFFLVRKFIWKPKKIKTTKACGSDDGCGCS